MMVDNVHGITDNGIEKSVENGFFGVAWHLEKMGCEPMVAFHISQLTCASVLYTMVNASVPR